ncbi:MAG: ABC transporter ATP-binding protein [Gammaproteobacteria bacterium]|uniref:ABC transporter ATP-binding protein n=1 Tax=Pseudomaricurvus alcaniphilus TaxID=1166482 RepID=UPI00140BDABF|nr:ABC transporter ATP-binding protein [Pseudomaricurvus alcaniphilus]MBR9909037.1 ABC transporter ATP-binding protein [Gammaproteobacteria bacterium]NHN38089.1 ABC transporter ATP-binding protein [Pseudomaricurvus alcaniphilus]
MTPIIEVRNLNKQFKNVKAVNGISFSIAAGTCFGLLGPNGAGKTTTIEMMERISKPSSGEILYKGQIDNPAFKQEAGIQFQSTSLMDYLTVREVLELFASFYQRPMAITELAKLCHLQEFLHHQAAKLSGGQRQRVLLAVALVNDPDIIFLDEPTTGLDPQSRRNFWSLIEGIKRRGKTIVLTTHYMDEAERLCDQLVIVDRGQVIAEGTPQSLLRSHFNHIFVCLNQADVPADFQFEGKVNADNGQVIFESTSVERTLKQLIEQGARLNSLQVRNPTLDDLFLKLTGHSLRE